MMYLSVESVGIFEQEREKESECEYMCVCHTIYAIVLNQYALEFRFCRHTKKNDKNGRKKKRKRENLCFN